jgi:PKHD-type hydroxylase
VKIGTGRMRYQSALRIPVENYRSALTLWLDEGPETELLTERFSRVIRKANEHYGFEITGFRDAFLLAQYGKGDGFEWHLDAASEKTSTRKLSLTAQLSDPDDYDGGNLEFMPAGEVPFSRDRGSVIIFPAFLCHRVTPVKRGMRSAIVAWAHGPTFR